jgi:hypothetical protein
MTTNTITVQSGSWLDLLATQPLFGGDRPGYQTQGDVLVDKTADGVPLSTMWQELLDVVEAYNDERSALAKLLSHNTTAVADAVPQSVTADSFEMASELGVPKAVGRDDALLLGYAFTDYDLASRFTWRFLRDATADQVRASNGRILEADNRLVNASILRRLFTPTEGLNEHGHRVFGLWNGDGIKPNPYMGKTFDGTHTHYFASQAAQIDSGDIEAGIRLVTEHGYGRTRGAQLLILANPNDGEWIQSWRAGAPSRPSGPDAKWSFIPSSAAPPYLTTETLVGTRAPADYQGLPVAGSYGPAWLVQSEFVPSGYVAVVASGGPDSLVNPVAVREHPNAAYRGLRIIPGLQQRYPLIDSFAIRSFGVGVRHRGAAVCIQVTVGTTYTAPTIQI